MSSEENATIARRYFEEVLAGDMTVADEVLADDLAFYGPNYWGEAMRGREQFKQFVAYLRTAFPDIRFTVEEEISGETGVATRFTLRATHRGAWMGIPPTGREIALPGADVFRIADGRISEVRVFYDTLGLMEQLGVAPAQGAASPAEEVVTKYFRALEERDVDKVAGLLVGDFVFVNPVEPMSKEDFLRFMEGLFAGFPDYRFDHGDMRADGDVVTVGLRMSGTHTGTLDLPMPGLKPVPATGKKVVLPEQRFDYEVRDGRIATITPEPMPHAGIIGLLEQIGVKLPPLWMMKLVARAARLRKGSAAPALAGQKS